MNFGKMIGRHRSAIMGAAALWVIAFHCHMKTSFALWNIVANSYGNVSVDFFIFITGFGLAHSLKKNPDFYQFYGRRMMRILPAYCVIILINIILCFAIGKPSPESLLQGMIPLGTWLGSDKGYWYIEALIVFYAIAPIFYWLISNAGSPRGMVIALMLFTGIAVPSIANLPSANIALMRVPVLILGLGIGIFHQDHTKRSDKWLDLMIIVLTFAAGIALKRDWVSLDIISAGQQRRLEKSLLAPLMVVAAAYGFEILNRTPLRFIGSFFECIGKYSLEIYLDHLIVYMFANTYFGIRGFACVLTTMVLSWAFGIPIALCAKKLAWIFKKSGILKLKESV